MWRLAERTECLGLQCRIEDTMQLACATRLMCLGISNKSDHGQLSNGGVKVGANWYLKRAGLAVILCECLLA